MPQIALQITSQQQQENFISLSFHLRQVAVQITSQQQQKDILFFSRTDNQSTAVGGLYISLAIRLSLPYR